jgi:uncharacterized membrane protein
MFGRRTTTTTRRPRSRAVWAALVTSVVLCVLIVVGVLLPVLTLIGAADGGTAGALDVPVGSIAAAIAIGCVLALALLLLVVRVRTGALAWVLGVAAVISTLVVSLWPLVAVAIAGVDQVQDLIPFIQDLIARFWPGT